jgi:hypothetical protein
MLVAAAATLGAARDASAQIIIPAPPPPVFVATVQPEYYEGHPVYWYHNNWYYRDAHGWRYYHTEPRYLHERRGHWDEHARYHYHR